MGRKSTETKATTASRKRARDVANQDNEDDSRLTLQQNEKNKLAGENDSSVNTVVHEVVAEITNSDSMTKSACEVVASYRTAQSNAGKHSETRKYMRYTDVTSDKFYEISICECEVNTRAGSIGKDGLISFKVLSSPAKAQEFMKKNIADRLKKGFVIKDECQCLNGCFSCGWETKK